MTNTRERFKLVEPGKPTIALQVQRPDECAAAIDVIYVHGATFGADLSVFFPFDGRSWADALNDIGVAAWGFDFVGYGDSDRYPRDLDRPACLIDDAIVDLRRVVAAVRARNGNRRVAVLAHSRGCLVAARYAAESPHDVAALALFGPIGDRPASSALLPQSGAADRAPSHYPLTVWAQYRRFIEDVPRGHPQVLNEGHFQDWSTAFLASDTTSSQRSPPSVNTPYGPVADVQAVWSGQTLYDAGRIVAPTLIVRGEWDSVCSDRDAERLLGALGTADKTDVKIERAAHLMHLEQQRGELYARVNEFLLRVRKF